MQKLKPRTRTKRTFLYGSESKKERGSFRQLQKLSVGESKSSEAVSPPKSAKQQPYNRLPQANCVPVYVTLEESATSIPPPFHSTYKPNWKGGEGIGGEEGEGIEGRGGEVHTKEGSVNRKWASKKENGVRRRGTAAPTWTRTSVLIFFPRSEYFFFLFFLFMFGRVKESFRNTVHEERKK